MNTVRLEFHCHTIYSRDSLTGIENLLATCRKKRIDRLVITDHNTIAGAQLAKRLDPDRVIIGEEIMTGKGELLAAFVSEEIPSGLTPLETIARLRDQGAFISVSHPFDEQRKGHWEIEDLQEITPYVDAIETFNARCMSDQYNRQAQEFARENGLSGTAGSDAHATFEVGRACMILDDFSGPKSLKSALVTARFDARLSSPFVHLVSRYAVWHKRVISRK